MKPPRGSCQAVRALSHDRLRLHVAESFCMRLLGLHAHGSLAMGEGLLIRPCRAVHTFFLRQPIDIVFLDADGRACHCVPGLRPGRLAMHRQAYMVVELTGGYCARYSDYLCRIQHALQELGG